MSEYLETVHLKLGMVIYESGQALREVYFPIDCIISLLCVMNDGDSAEIAIVGNEGMVGIAQIMGGETTTSRAVVQSEGSAYRLNALVMRDEFSTCAPLRELLLLYTQALMTQMMQTAGCNLHHSVEQQFCRWLLMSLDRLPSDKIMMTQGLIANMLGLRRVGVTDAARKLQDVGIIQYSAGTITVLDRKKLQQHACECYAAVKRELDRLLPGLESKVNEPSSGT